jgi:hypothetical protein
MKRTLLSEWDSYRTLVVPADAPPIQQQETRRAFYAGAQAMLVMISATSERGPDEGVADIEALQVELAAFVGRVQAGKA